MSMYFPSSGFTEVLMAVYAASAAPTPRLVIPHGEVLYIILVDELLVNSVGVKGGGEICAIQYCLLR